MLVVVHSSCDVEGQEHHGGGGAGKPPLVPCPLGPSALCRLGPHGRPVGGSCVGGRTAGGSCAARADAQARCQKAPAGGDEVQPLEDVGGVRCVVVPGEQEGTAPAQAWTQQKDTSDITKLSATRHRATRKGITKLPDTP